MPRLTTIVAYTITIYFESQLILIMLKKLTRYIQAVGIFARTPFVGAKRSLPKPLSGVKRKIFSLNVFMAEAWKVSAKRKELPVQSFLTMELGSDYVCRIDDILDQAIRPSVETEQLKYKKDIVARKMISRFVGQVKKLPLTKQERNAIIRLVADFRKNAIAALVKFEKNPNPTKQDILMVKENTTGSMAVVGISVLNICERIPKKEARELEEAFSNLFMAAQIADDIFDLRIDRQNRVPNLALVVLKEHPQELNKALKRQKITMLWFRRSCPASYKELMHLCEGYISKIPKTTIGLQILATIPRIFWKIIALTSR